MAVIGEIGRKRSKCSIDDDGIDELLKEDEQERHYADRRFQDWVDCLEIEEAQVIDR